MIYHSKESYMSDNDNILAGLLSTINEESSTSTEGDITLSVSMISSIKVNSSTVAGTTIRNLVSSYQEELGIDMARIIEYRKISNSDGVITQTVIPSSTLVEPNTKYQIITRNEEKG